MTITYRHCVAESSKLNESRDCSVKALAIAAGIPYGKAHDILAILGRKQGKGFRYKNWDDFRAKWRMAVSLAGRKPMGYDTPQGYTMRTIGERCCQGTYLVWVKGHVAAVVNGEVMDWTKGRLHRVTHTMRVGV